jgi:hypothetical protein
MKWESVGVCIIIRNFLSQRTIRVKVGRPNGMNKEFMVESLIPQGTATSPILFNIMVNV